MSSVFRLFSKNINLDIPYRIFPLAYDYILKKGFENFTMNVSEQKGIIVNNHNLYTAGFHARSILCIRYYPNPFKFDTSRIWREDDMLQVDECFDEFKEVIFLKDFHIKLIKK